MDDVASLIASAGEPDSKIVSIIEKIFQLLIDRKLAWRGRLPPRVVGVHPANRSQWGVHPAEVHALGLKMWIMGFLLSATAHAVCIEDRKAVIAKFSGDMAATSNGKLGCTAAEVKFGSLACSHTNQWLVAILCACLCEYEELTVDGKLSYSKLSSDAALQDALDHGLEWLVLSADVVEMYPTLPDLIQSARNAPGAAHQKEDAFQLLQKVQQMAIGMPSGSTVVDWNAIKHTMIRRGQTTIDELEPLLAFAQRYGGGSSSAFIEDVARFHKVSVPAGRIVPPSTWIALAGLRVAPHELCPLFIYAVLKTQASCPIKKCDGGRICNYITASDITSLAAAKKKDMLEAEKLLTECRALARNSRAPADVQARALGRLDVFMVRLVLNKKDGIDGIETVHDVAKRFMAELGGEAVKKHGPAASSRAQPNVVQYDGDGTPVSTGMLAVKTAGYAEGLAVKNKDSGELHTIEKISNDGCVSLKSMQTSAVTEVSCDEFMNTFRITNEKFQMFEGWSDQAPSKQWFYKEHTDRAIIAVALQSMAHGVATPKLRIMLKPSKSVFADDSYTVGKLVLVPETTKVIFDDRASNAMKGSIAGSAMFQLLPNFSETFAVPAWIVKSTDDPDVANMKIATRKVAVSTAGDAIEVSFPKHVNIPVMTNSKKLKAGDELFVFREAPEKVATTAKRPLNLKVDHAPKAKAKPAAKK